MSHTHAEAGPRYVVGIGASAGGLDALERFFDNLPERTGMAFVVVQHLSPDFKSLMDELLGRRTELPIHLVEDMMVVEPDHVYLIPPKKEMIISGGKLLLSERDPQQELTLPIDVFFRSLAQDAGSRAVGIVLSGAGSDGTRGVREIHAAGGLVLVQDLDTAQFDGMPKTARDAGVADWVLSPEEMPSVLVRHAETEIQSRKAAGRGVGEVAGIDAVYRMLEEEHGIDFTHYKPSTVTRRIERRLLLAQSQNIGEYVAHLSRDRAELDILYRDLLIGVTRFFRDEGAFKLLEEQILPDLLRQLPPGAPLRVWVAGTATGEEAYSLAIVISDLMTKLGERPVKIFATDVHRGSIEQAARGIYDEEAVANVSKQRLERYFSVTGGIYQVVPELRQMVVFAVHNVIKDAPFTRVDLITCRNLLIYLQPPAQQRVLSFFHFALNRGGVLVLGPSESPGSLAHDFEYLNKHWRILRKHSDSRTSVETRLRPSGQAHVRLVQSLQPLPVRSSSSHLMGTYDALLEEFMPPSLLVDERGALLHVFGGAGRFLRAREGRQSLDVLDCVGAELKMVLTSGLKRALKEPAGIVFNGLRLESNGDDGVYKVTIRQVAGPRSGAHLLISFDTMHSVARAAAPSETQVDLDNVSREQLATLEAELGYTKESLQATVEQLETSNEELQASNEELQASNEELQSTNEELQSVNEELYTVNSEYQRKIAELTELTNDMDNLLSSTDVGTIFLDRSLKIRKFTPQIGDTFALVPHDVGRSIETFVHKMEHPELVGELKRVLASGERLERELNEVQGRSFFLRILPYRVKGTVDGVVLTLIDVSGLRAAQDALFHERYLLNSLLSSVPDAIYFKDDRGRFIRTNHAMAERLGLPEPRAAEGKSAFELVNRDIAVALDKADDTVLRGGEPQHYKLEKRVRADGVQEWDVVTRLPLRDQSDSVVGVIGIFRNVTEQKRAEERIQDAVRLRDEFLAMLSHELRNPLGAMVTATGLIKGDESLSSPSRRFLDVLDRQSQQMARLLDDLLEASRVTQNKIQLRKRVVDLASVVRDASDALDAVMKSGGLRFSTHVDHDAIHVVGDPARLQQIHVNLLSNAAKYTPRGGQVRLEVTRDESAAVIRVKDDGVGIPKDMLEQVFELFVQSKRTLDRSSGGLGVGLTLVRSLVAMHGGTVEVHSDGEGKGSEFVVRLPLAMTDAMEPEAGMVDEEPAPVVRARLPERASVVIVEDNPDSREVLCELLRRSGFECHAADNGAAGLALIEKIRPDLAILDVGLPEMDGFEVARRLRSKPTHARTVLIALTGYGRDSDRAAARSAGFDGHVVKPVQAEQLLRLLADMRGDSSGEARTMSS